jgi:leucyl aminopeptidase
MAKPLQGKRRVEAGQRANPTSKGKTSKTLNKSASSDRSFLGFSSKASLLGAFEVLPKRPAKSSPEAFDGEVHIFGSLLKTDKERQVHESAIFKDHIGHWQQVYLDQRTLEVVFLQTARGPAWIVRPNYSASAPSKSCGVRVSASYALLREKAGALWPSLRDAPSLKTLSISFHGCTDEDIMGALVGFELSSYRFLNFQKKDSSRVKGPKVSLIGVSSGTLRAASAMATSINLSRHLVNLDAAKLHPKSYAEGVASWFKGKAGVKVEVWGPDKVKSEGMNLLAAVGQGAEHRSHMVHVQYRPQKKQRFSAPIAFVGKGVTFDSGGLDIKPPSGMRLMKKDMGGSASVVGLANWVVESESDIACDFYLALAENSVDGNSFRPGDVLTARNGLTVEIHNTDAEGRLVMADVFDVAQTNGTKPLALINLSTLTGAMRVAVGAEIAGMFSTSDSLAERLLEHGMMTGDPCWRLPLWENYRGLLKSNFAEIANASESGFAGAITAALFLQRFIKGDLPWIHFDLYCWTERNGGSFQEPGGNGQGIQMLASFLDRLTSTDFKM